MAKTRAQKEETVVKLTEKLSRAKAVVFADYKGLSMKQLSDLRDKLSEVNGEFSITKNTLLKRALSAINLEGPARNAPAPTSQMLAGAGGPTATLFAYDDEVSPIKILVKALKDATLGKVKGGFLGNAALDEARILQLATLPGKDELRAKTVGVLVAPLQGIVGVLNANLRNLVYALNQIKLQRGGDA